jgi:outer membrane protein assembly factor BamA
MSAQVQLSKESIDSLTVKQFIIRSITFEGNEITKPKIIEREMNIHKGYIINKSDLINMLEFNKSRILNLQLFTKVSYTIQLVQNDSLDVNYKVNEYFYWIPEPIFSLADRNFNVWWKEFDGQLSRTNIGMTVTRMNFRGRAERIGGTVQVGYNKFFDVFYKIPYIDRSLQHGLGISATYQTGREINYTTDFNKLLFFSSDLYPYKRFQTELTYTYRPAYALIHEVNLSYNNYSISPELFNRNPAYLGLKRKKINYLELKYLLKFNNTNVRIFPTRGIDFQTYVSRKGLGIDKDINQFIVYTEINLYQPILKNLSMAYTFRGRLLFNDHHDVPYLFSKGMGYKNDYVRGYEYYVVDGNHFGLFRASARYKIFDRTIEQPYINAMKFIPIRLYAKAYDDLGAVMNKNEGNSFLNNKLLNGYGVGVDLIIAYNLKFRFEYSFNHLGENELFLHGNKE